MSDQGSVRGRVHSQGDSTPGSGPVGGGASIPSGGSGTLLPHSGEGRASHSIPGSGGYQGGGSWGGGRGGPPQVYRPRNGTIPAPDATVQYVEDARQAARQSPNFTMSTLSLTDNTMPVRPGYGTEGTPITVFANYVPLLPRSDLVLYMYDMQDIWPEVLGKKRTQVIRLMLNESPELATVRQDIVTDFKSTLISRKKLALKRDFIKVTYKSEGEDDACQRAWVYQVPVKFTKTLTVSQLITYLTSTDPDVQYDSKLDMVQGLNIFLNHYAKTCDKLVTIGPSKTFAMGTGNMNVMPLGQGLNAIRGYFTSVRAATNRILVNINVSHGAFYQEGKLTNLIAAFRAQPFRKKASLIDIETFLKRLRIRTTHLKARKNRYGEVIIRAKSIVALAKPYKPKKNTPQPVNPPKVDYLGAGPRNVKFWLRGQAQGPTGRSSSGPSVQPSRSTSDNGKGQQKSPKPIGPQPVESSTGRYITVYDYFKNTYALETSNDFPVVNVGTEGEPSYLPAEVCVVLPGQSANVKLSSEQTRQMISFAVRRPWENAQSIENDGMSTAGLSNQTNALLDQFGLSVGQNLITIPARVLKNPSVHYQKKIARVVNGSWNMADIRFNKPGQLKRWSFIAIRDAEAGYKTYEMKEIQDAVKGLTKALRLNGLDLKEQVYREGKEVSMKDSADKILDNWFKLASNTLDLLLIVLPGKQKTEPFNNSVYSYVKTLGDTKYGIHTICVMGDKFKKGNPQYFGNVALKFNLKLGGHNQAVEQSRLSFIVEDKTMLVGIDVTHPSPGSHSATPSVAGMVASIDRHLGQWPATLRVQKARQEMVSDLDGMIETHLDYWKTIGKHSSYPENILVYRDGVSEGQYDDVLNQEVDLLRKACKTKYPKDMSDKNLPKLTVIIVGKRHHTRFYPTRNKDMDTNPNTGSGSSNLRPGTVVDRGVTEEGTWDFFLQAHAVLQGTARPAHYVVVLDQIFRARASSSGGATNVASEVEKLTQALCYTYSRATRAVSICTPVYHADLVCERARRYMADLFEGGSVGAAKAVGEGSAGGKGLAAVAVHSRLEATMYYI